jgi:hypothetical protein
VRRAIAGVSRRLAPVRGTLRPLRHPYEDLPLLIVSGVGRSGTTALRNAIAACPRVDAANRESNFIRDLLEVALRNCTLPVRKASMAVTQQEYDLVFRRAILWLAWPQPRREPPRPAALCTYTNLDPETASHLLQVFPGAKVAYIVRDGIEVVASRMGFESFAADSFETQCQRWRTAGAMARWIRGNPAAGRLVRHEILRDPERREPELAAVLALVGVAYDPACGELLRSAVYHPTRQAGESEAAAGDLATRGERWRAWGRDERAVFERTCRDTMESLGYAIPWLDG